MADKAVSNQTPNPLGFFLNTAKAEPSNKPILGAVLAPVYDPGLLKGRVLAVDDNNNNTKKTPVSAVTDVTAELFKRLYGL
jgi:hypothetical protein